jgi:hypothetical protein
LYRSKFFWLSRWRCYVYLQIRSRRPMLRDLSSICATWHSFVYNQFMSEPGELRENQHLQSILMIISSVSQIVSLVETHHNDVLIYRSEIVPIIDASSHLVDAWVHCREICIVIYWRHSLSFRIQR